MIGRRYGAEVEKPGPEPEFWVESLLRTLLLPFRVVLAGLRRCFVSTLSILLGLVLLLGAIQARDLYADSSADIGTWSAFYVLVTFVWAIPVYAEARRALRRSPSTVSGSNFEYWLSILNRRWLPRALGIMPYILVLSGVWQARVDLRAASQFSGMGKVRVSLDIATIVGIAATIGYIFFVANRRRLASHLHTKRNSDQPGLIFRLKLSNWFGYFTFFVFVVILAFPLWFSELIPRTVIIPLMLGAWVPLVGKLFRETRRSGLPLVGAAFVVLVISWNVFDDVHNLRVLPERSKSEVLALGPRQTDLTSAIARWRDANDCSLPKDIKECPRPIVVAASGGASRAAFHTATVLGALLDATRANPTRYHDFGRAIFALSGVSGGALGVTISRAALQASAGDQRPPCRRSSSLWYGDNGAKPNTIAGWRQCLQILTAGDFLTATLIGLAFRDVIPVSLNGDRAELLERSIERHYSSIVGDLSSNAAVNPYRDCHSRSLPSPEGGLCAPFGYLPTSSTIPWLPLLILGSTSVETGRPVLISDLRPAMGSGVWIFFRVANLLGPPDLFPDGYDLFELLAATHGPLKTAPHNMTDLVPLPSSDDIRLSTAIVASARFPLITPSALLRTNDSDRSITTRLVDGGYYDNSGLFAIRGLVRGLQSNGFRPIVISIENQPRERFVRALTLPQRVSSFGATLEETPQGFWSASWQLLTEPLAALDNTRSGHILRERRAMIEMLAERTGLKGDLFSVDVHDTISPDKKRNEAETVWCTVTLTKPVSMSRISMSWWISRPVQWFLDMQLCQQSNVATLNKILDLLKRPSSPAG